MFLFIVGSYNNWGPGEPDNEGGTEKCAIVDGDHPGYRWADKACPIPHPYVCQLGKYTHSHGHTDYTQTRTHTCTLPYTHGFRLLMNQWNMINCD